MTDLKIKIKDWKHGDFVQRKLFKLGYGWHYDGKILNDMDGENLITICGTTLSFCSNETFDLYDVEDKTKDAEWNLL
jgi:hypothetical protein